MGQGLGALLIVPLSQFLISDVGWRFAFTILAGLMLLTVVPANAFFQRRSPKDLGQLPDGEMAPKAEPAGSQRRQNPKVREWTVHSAIRSFPFWSISLGHVAIGMGLFMIITHVVAHMVSLGFDKLVAAFVVGMIGFVRIGGTALWGFVSDHLGRQKAFGLSTLIIWAGLAGLVGIHSGSPLWLVYAAAIVYGIGHSAGNPTYGALIADIFSGAKIGTIYGIIEISFGLGSAFGAWLGGYLYDLTGSYRLPFSICFLSFGISYLAVYSCQAWHSRELSLKRQAANSSF